MEDPPCSVSNYLSVHLSVHQSVRSGIVDVNTTSDRLIIEQLEHEITQKDGEREGAREGERIREETAHMKKDKTEWWWYPSTESGERTYKTREVDKRKIRVWGVVVAWTKEWHGGHGERDMGRARWRERDVGEGETRRKKQTPNSLFSLSNSGGARAGGGREREMRRNLRGVERDSHTFHKFDTENEMIPGESPLFSAQVNTWASPAKLLSPVGPF